jgi:post-segregation antitoxin (ccd killing protein)
MARVNIYLPDELAAEAKAAGLNVSQVAQEALGNELQRQRAAEWVARVRLRLSTGVTHEQVIDALHAVRDEMGTRGA